MNEQIERLREGFRAQLDAAASPAELDAVRVAYLGKKGPVSDLMKGLRDMTDEERRQAGSLVNQLKEELAAAKKSLENVYCQLTDSPAAMESFYYGRALLGLDLTIDATRALFAGVKREQIVEAARALRCDTVYFLRGTLPSDGSEDYDEEN